MFRTKPAARRLACSLAVAVALATIAPSVVAAQPTQTVAELQAEAKRVAAELTRLNLRSGQLDEEYLAAKHELGVLEAELAAKQAAVAAAQDELEDNTASAKSYAIEAYVNGGDVDPTIYSSNDIADASHRQAFLASMHSDRTQAMEDLRAAQQRLGDEQRALDGAKADIEAKAAALEATQSKLQATIAEQSRLKSSVEGDLAEAVRAEQERQAAAREAAARRAAQQEADRAAAASARARTAVPPRASVVASAHPAKSGGTAPGPAFPDPGPVSPGAATAIAAAKSQLGVPYRWGGATPGKGFDCSGLIMYAWGQAGKSLPHSSRALFSMSQRISADQLQPGDLVFGGNPVHHVGLYVGNGLMVHAPHSGDVVRVAGIYGTSKPVRFGRL